MEKKNSPFCFTVQLSIDLSDDEELMRLIVEAGVGVVCIGIETPHKESLIECRKFQNLNHDIIVSIKKIQQYNLKVMGFFIVGFDHDPPSIFDTIISLIQECKMVVGMISLLNPIPGTRLYHRLKREGRLLKKDPNEYHSEGAVYFITKMGHRELIKGYAKLITTIYRPRNYYARVKAFLKDYEPALSADKISFRYFTVCIALLKSIFLLGIVGEERFQYWKLTFWCLFRRPRMYPTALEYAILGFHFRKTYRHVALECLKQIA